MSLEKHNANGDFEDDYLELLNSVKTEDDGIQKKSQSTVQRTFEDVSSYDVPISKSKSRRRGFEDVYSSTGTAPNTEKGIDDDIIITRRPQRPVTQRPVTQRPLREPEHRESVPRRPAPPPVEKNAAVDDEEISDFEERHGKTHNNKKKSGGSKFKAFIALLLVAAIVFAGVVFVKTNSVFNSFNTADKVESIVDASALRSAASVKNILFIGLDDAFGETSRSDSMMLVSVNEKTGKIVVTSVLRDIHVKIPGHGEAKINAAFSWGGAELLVQTIEQNFGIRVDGYASVDFNMFISLVDTLGGVKISMTEAETEYMNERINYMFPEETVDFIPGELTVLDGKQALEYARMREIDNDFERTGRQRKIIQSIAAEVRDSISPAGIFRLLETGKAVAPFITTTFSSGELTRIMLSVAKCAVAAKFDMNSLIVSQRIPYDDGGWWYFDAWDGSAIGIDFETNCELLYGAVFDGNFPDSSQSDE